MYISQKTTSLLAVLLFVPFVLVGQAEPESRVFSSKELSATLMISLAIISGMTSLVTAIIVTKRRVRAEVETLVQEKAKIYVDELFKKDLGIDLKTAREFFRKLQLDAQKLSNTQVWIVNAQNDKDRIQLFEAIKEAGFLKPKSVVVQQSAVEPEPGDLIVFDGTQHLTETEIVAFGQPLGAVAHFFYYGRKYQSDDQLKMRGYANTPDTLVKRLKEVVLD